MNIGDTNQDLSGPSKCLTCSRPSAPALRSGLCMLCHSKAKKMVEAGATTWIELYELGLALPGVADGGDPFTEAFKKAKGV